MSRSMRANQAFFRAALLAPLVVALVSCVTSETLPLPKVMMSLRSKLRRSRWGSPFKRLVPASMSRIQPRVGRSRVLIQIQMMDVKL